MNARTIATSVHSLLEQTLSAVRDLSAAVDLVEDEHVSGIAHVNSRVLQLQEVSRIALDDLTLQTLECTVALQYLRDELAANIAMVKSRQQADALALSAQLEQLHTQSNADIAELSSNLDAQTVSISLDIGTLATDLTSNVTILHDEIDIATAQALASIAAVEANLFGNINAITEILTPLSNLEVSALQANLVAVQMESSDLRADVSAIYANDIIVEHEISLLVANISQTIYTMSNTVSSLFGVL